MSDAVTSKQKPESTAATAQRSGGQGARGMFRGRVRCIHFVGIGGVGMSGIAEVLLDLGFEVHGSDMREGEAVTRLRGLGAVVHIGHRAENVAGADVLVKSTAVGVENPEIQEAMRTAVPVIRRAEMLAELMRLKHGVAIAGSHGKTTTTSLVAAILNHAGIDPTVVIGGKVNQLGANARLGAGEYLVAEADESDGTFLQLSPSLALVTNLDLEHVDFWTGGLPQLKDAFVQFLNRVPFYGLAVVCIDAENVQALLPRLSRRVVTYGKSRQADLQARRIRTEGPKTFFDVYRDGELRGEVELALVGDHNVLNALGAMAIADELGVDFEKSQEALKAFGGVQRRFTLRGEVGGIQVIDDYGHHPTEIRATLQSARQAFPGRRIVVCFQPHRYSRTHALLADFARAFNDADVLRLTDVYAAGEAPIEGARAHDLAQAIGAHGHRDVSTIGEVTAAAGVLAPLVKADDIVITLGAGSITQVGPDLLQLLTSASAGAGA